MTRTTFIKKGSFFLIAAAILLSMATCGTAAASCYETSVGGVAVSRCSGSTGGIVGHGYKSELSVRNEAKHGVIIGSTYHQKGNRAAGRTSSYHQISPKGRLVGHTYDSILSD